MPPEDGRLHTRHENSNLVASLCVCLLADRTLKMASDSCTVLATLSPRTTLAQRCDAISGIADYYNEELRAGVLCGGLPSSALPIKVSLILKTWFRT